MSEVTSIAQSLYPDLVSDSGYFWGPGDYQPIVNHFGEVLAQVEAGEWQGDTFALLRKDDRFGLFIFGWGSCSGCDALQACSTYEKIDELIEKLRASIKWFDTIGDAAVYISLDSERSLSYYYHEEGWSTFKDKVAALVEQTPAPSV